jgi:hypothetical protein
MDASVRRNSGRIAALGVLAAAVAGVAVMRPALEAFAYSEINWAVIAYVALPLLVLFGTGVRRYGVVVSAVVAVVVTGVAAVTAGLLFVLVLGLSLGGSSRSSVFWVALWVAPPLLTLLLGGAALRLLRPRVQAGS